MHSKKPPILPPSLKFTFIILLCLITQSVQAYVEPDFPPLVLELNDPNALLIDPEAERLDENKGAMINSYYDQCVAANASPDFEDTMKLQCACTAAEIDKIMDVKQVRNMFKTNNTGNFEYARMMLLAYLPCMEDTITQYTYDTCVFDGRESTKSRQELAMCRCAAGAIQSYVNEKQYRLIPGFYKNYYKDPLNFDKKEAVANTIGYVMTRKRYQDKYNHELYVCGLHQIED